MHIITDERCTAYSSIGHPERPRRITDTVEKLRAQTDLAITWEKPATVAPEVLQRAHTREHLARVKAAAGAFDGDTPAHDGIFDHANRSVGGALKGLELARAGKSNFTLLRPPGHHATRERAMGFCYLNSIATAALHALATGTKRVAVYDFDVHHGNGTEAILLNHPGACFTSIHQHPCYPGTGAVDAGDNCFNFPVAPQTPRVEYRKTFEKAFARMNAFQPEIVFVSAGFDAYARDPLAHETLEAEDFHWLGAEMRKLGLPIVSVLEGGYSRDLPELILAYLKGLEGG